MDLRQARKDRGKTLAEVAGEIGIDQGNLSRIERGEQLPSRDLARRLFDYYGGNVEWEHIFGVAPRQEAA